MKTYPLRRFVHRVLLIRLGIATVLIALVIAVISYFTLNARLKQEVIDYAHGGVSNLLRDVTGAMEIRSLEPAEALREVLAGREAIPYHAGQFVNVQFYDAASTIIAEKSVPDEQARAFMEREPFRFPSPGQIPTETIEIGDNLYVFLSLPILDRQGTVRAYGRGLFAVSPAMLTEMGNAIVRNILIIVAIVFSVSAILYPVILQLMRRLADYSSVLLDTNLETIAVLGSAIAKRDSDTDAHNYRVSLYSARIGEALGLPPQQMRTLIKGAFLHDVGKIGIPDNILLKPGRLDEQEFSVMKSHVDKGVDIVARSSWLTDAISVVNHHHEKYAGGGYPKNLSGEEIPIEARIFAVADVFDALTSERPYKKPLSFEATMDILNEGRGSHFDPEVLDAFGTVARELYDRYGSHEGADLRQELISLVEKYFSAGLEALQYGMPSES